MKHEITLKQENFEKILLGVRTFLVWKENVTIQEGDTVRFMEQRDKLFTGRNVECTITDDCRKKYSGEHYCLLSFQVTFPDTEPKIPVKVYMELWNRWVQTARELDALKAERAEVCL